MKLLSILLAAIWVLAAALLWLLLSTAARNPVTVLPTVARGEPLLIRPTLAATLWSTVTAIPTETPTHTPIPPTMVLIATPTATPYIVTATAQPQLTPYVVTATPNPLVTPYIVTATAPPLGPSPTQGPVLLCACVTDLYNCPAFSSTSAAQACFNFCVSQGVGDIHKLDQDHDGLACEQSWE